MKILFAGDTHNNTTDLEYLVYIARQNQVDLIFQVGDFGFILQTNRLNLVSEILAGMPLAWLDGNHENFEEMLRLGLDPNGHKPVEALPGITYYPRGCRFILGATTCMSFGGAVSVDKTERIPLVDWWPWEEITEAQIAAVQPGPVDLLLTHDCPSGGTVLDRRLAWSADWWDKRCLRESDANRQRLRVVFDLVTPKRLIHGHYHYRYNDTIDGCDVIGLNCGPNDPQSWVILNL